MAMIDIAGLSPKERLELIAELWDSLEGKDIPLTPAQTAELDKRTAALDSHPEPGRDAGAVSEELRGRYR